MGGILHSLNRAGDQSAAGPLDAITLGEVPNEATMVVSVTGLP